MQRAKDIHAKSLCARSLFIRLDAVLLSACAAGGTSAKGERHLDLLKELRKGVALAGVDADWAM